MKAIPLEQVNKKFTENLKIIFELIYKNPEITLDEIAEKVGVSRRAVINNINKLKEIC